jgi:hypothetical protein
MSREYSTHGRDKKSVKKKLGRKTRGKEPLGRFLCRCGNNIKMEIREILLKIVDWMYLAQVRDQWQALVNTVMNYRIT